MSKSPYSPQTQVQVIPPTAEQIKALAQSVCAGLAERHQDERYTAPEVVSGLSHFLQVVVRIQAKHYGQLFDNRTEAGYAEDQQTGQQGAANTPLP